MAQVAKAVRLAAVGIVALIVLGIVVVLTEANTGNWLIGAIDDVARWFVSPFTGIYEFDETKAQVAINWGIAAAVYGVLAALLAGGLERLGRSLRDRREDSEQADGTGDRASHAS